MDADRILSRSFPWQRDVWTLGRVRMLLGAMVLGCAIAQVVSGSPEPMRHAAGVVVL